LLSADPRIKADQQGSGLIKKMRERALSSKTEIKTNSKKKV